MLKKYFFTFLMITVIFCKASYSEQNPFDILKNRLVADGFEKEFLDKTYSNEEANYIPDIIIVNVKQHPERANYVQYFDNASVINGKNYLSENNEFLAKMQDKYGVPREVIVSILMVETRLGSFLGKNKVINVYSSMAISDTDEAIDRIYKKYEEDSLLAPEQKLSKEAITEKVKRTANWGYKELKIFLNYIKQQEMDPYKIVGSISGAFGIAQFIPSSLVHYGADGNDDGKINLFDYFDAMASIANYLKENGWKRNMSSEDEKKVIATYNKSSYYVDAVLKFAEKLKESN